VARCSNFQPDGPQNRVSILYPKGEVLANPKGTINHGIMGKPMISSSYKYTAFNPYQSRGSSAGQGRGEQGTRLRESPLLPCILRQPEGKSDAHTGHMQGILWAAGISPQGSEGEGRVGTLPLASGTSSSPG